MPDRYRRIIVVGDLHGSLNGLRTILRAADLIDEAEEWTGGRTILVQTGDVVDRGPDARGCLDLLHRLRREARHTGGEVTLLLGNHEIGLIEQDFWMTDDPNPPEMADRLRREVLRGQWSAAKAIHRYLITHAGIRPDLLGTLLAEIREKKGPHRVTVALIARHINAVVEQAVELEDFSHPVFDIGPARGGRHPGGGIFWADFEAEHGRWVKGPRLWQVFGHSPPIDTNGRLFRTTADRMRINVDVGICEHYGGNHGYLELEKDQVVGILVGETIERQTLVSAKEHAKGIDKHGEIAAE